MAVKNDEDEQKVRPPLAAAMEVIADRPQKCAAASKRSLPSTAASVKTDKCIF
jgi:hypothetical protein